MATSQQTKLEFDPAPALDVGGTIMPNGSLKFVKTIRIAVSGDVRLTYGEWRVVDSIAFQRLRRVKQLGASCYVYPTALHTRFDHSLGVLHEVDQLILKINDNISQGYSISQPIEITPRQRIIARLYALLHDITHVPFGHTLEDELKIFPSHDEFQKSDDSDLSRFEETLGPNTEIGRIIVEVYGAEIYDRFRNVFLIGGRKRIPVEESTGNAVNDEVTFFLVSNTVCADLFDYIKRDSYFTNLNINVSERIQNYMYVSVISEDGIEKTLPVIRLWKKNEGRARADLLTDLTSLLEARYMIGERVYFHHAKIIVDAMIGRAVYEAVRNGKLNSLAMLKYSDDSLLDYLSGLKAPKLEVAQRLASDIMSRRLYKRIEKYGIDKFGDGGDRSDLAEEALSVLKKPELRTKIEDDISFWAGGAPGDVLIFPPSRKMNSKVARAIVDWRGRQIPLSEIDDAIVKPRLDLLKESHKRLWGIHLLASPNFSEDQRDAARRAFDGYFLGKVRAIDSFEVLFREKVDDLEKMSNRSTKDRKAVSKHAAKAFVGNNLSFHGAAGEKIGIVIQNYIDQAIDAVL
ncbi:MULTISPECIES: HD domain-containing protein [unclassified Mesorhizobium]|uniref:HD domain-containing protein n=1 Tax=unclassified Mesorhizobium TaxID=325217 RepID=UPI0003CF856A|nr:MULTISPECIES: HD domain-containing protein [unclassified Mesorhizobium]ESX22252.1 hypothetical protein X766_04220 [Mesorhizobium sp. LSJC255A00]ESX30661.1 hypothetical protein X765_08735 [Mesorhizobium sp. LSHC440B00]ESX37703.1 hypothetical protein X763_08515 [Mesorhizobium sp. LSHC432A00]ESX41057.1 hypothetical protein X764_18650 [Mesorhizobium sp. LSHC440A00]ESX65465.1 hypothetical protein X757_32350 [Mesorhizobium sp. LSHC414A00]